VRDLELSLLTGKSALDHLHKNCPGENHSVVRGISN